MDAIRSVYSLATSSFYLSHQHGMYFIAYILNRIPRILEIEEKDWKENGRVAIDVSSLFSFFSSNKHKLKLYLIY